MAKLSNTLSRGFDTTVGTATTDRIECVGFDNGDFPTALTAAAWVYMENLPGGSQRIFDWRDTNEDAQLYFWTSSGVQRLEFNRHWSSGRGAWRVDGHGIPADTWAHVLLTYDGASTANDAAIYVDGVSQTINETDAPSGTIGTNTNNMFVGNRSSANRTFDGYIYDFAMWSSVLSAGNIALLAAGEDPDDVESPIIHYQMDGTGTGSSAETDHGSSSSPGKVTGATSNSVNPLPFISIPVLMQHYKRMRAG